MELVILNQTYSDWEWVSKENIKEIIKFELNPAEKHLFHGDVDEITEEIVIPSPIRTQKSIPCILDFNGSTHGRLKDKLLYRCIPDDKTIPHFIVPYQSKTTGFDKHKKNKYVLIQFKEWTQQEKHPIGILVNTLGDVDNYDAFTEYQLYSKELVISLNEFNKQTLFLKNKNAQDVLIDSILGTVSND